jgi:pyruvate/2-oxoglutarate/acetoin dehydrogenase E1 component
VQKTGRAVVVHEAPRTLGLGAEIIARVNDEALLSLEAPIRRVTGYDVPYPLYAREGAYLPTEERILQAIEETIRF